MGFLHTLYYRSYRFQIPIVVLPKMECQILSLVANTQLLRANMHPVHQPCVECDHRNMHMLYI